jgi:hypothetical protein
MTCRSYFDAEPTALPLGNIPKPTIGAGLRIGETFCPLRRLRNMAMMRLEGMKLGKIPDNQKAIPASN